MSSTCAPTTALYPASNERDSSVTKQLSSTSSTPNRDINDCLRSCPHSPATPYRRRDLPAEMSRRASSEPASSDFVSGNMAFSSPNNQAHWRRDKEPKMPTEPVCRRPVKPDGSIHKSSCLP